MITGASILIITFLVINAIIGLYIVGLKIINIRKFIQSLDRDRLAQWGFVKLEDLPGLFAEWETEYRQISEEENTPDPYSEIITKINIELSNKEDKK